MVCSKPIVRLAPGTAAGSVVVLALSPAILSMVHAVRAPLSCHVHLSHQDEHRILHMLVMSEGNNKVAAL